MLVNLGMKQQVNKSTKDMKDSQIITDLIFTNNKEVQVIYESKITKYV